MNKARTAMPPTRPPAIAPAWAEELDRVEAAVEEEADEAVVMELVETVSFRRRNGSASLALFDKKAEESTVAAQPDPHGLVEQHPQKGGSFAAQVQN